MISTRRPADLDATPCRSTPAGIDRGRRRSVLHSLPFYRSGRVDHGCAPLEIPTPRHAAPVEHQGLHLRRHDVAGILGPHRPEPAAPPRRSRRHTGSIWDFPYRPNRLDPIRPVQGLLWRGRTAQLASFHSRPPMSIQPEPFVPAVPPSSTIHLPTARPDGEPQEGLEMLGGILSLQTGSSHSATL
jgi:hypothetical protein